MARNPRFEISSSSSDESNFAGYHNGQRKHFSSASNLERSSSFRKNLESRSLRAGANFPKGSTSVHGEHLTLSKVDTLSMGNQKYHRHQQLKRVTNAVVGTVEEDPSLGAVQAKHLSSFEVEELKRLRSCGAANSLKGRKPINLLNEATCKLDSSQMLVRKRSQTKLSAPNPLFSVDPSAFGGNSLKVGRQNCTTSNCADLCSQRPDDRKSTIPNKRVLTSMMDMQVEGRPNKLPRLSVMTDRERDKLRSGNAANQLEDKDQTLPSGSESWEETKMKGRRSAMKSNLSVNAVANRMLDGDRDHKQGKRQRPNTQSCSRPSEGHGFRSNVCNKNHAARPTTITKGKASCMPRSSSGASANLSPNVSCTSPTFDCWEQASNPNRGQITGGSNSPKRPFSTGSSSAPVVQWDEQKPPKNQRTKKTNLVPPVSNRDNVRNLVEGSSNPESVAKPDSTESNGGGFLRRSSNNSALQQSRLKTENISSLAAFSKSKESGGGDKCKDKNKKQGHADEKIAPVSQKVGSLVLPPKKTETVVKEESGDGVWRQGRGGRANYPLRVNVPPSGKLENPATTKQLRSTRPGPDKVESKTGRPPTKKTSLDRKPVTRPRRPMNNELPDSTESNGGGFLKRSSNNSALQQSGLKTENISSLVTFSKSKESGGGDKCNDKNKKQGHVDEKIAPISQKVGSLVLPPKKIETVVKEESGDGLRRRGRGGRANYPLRVNDPPSGNLENPATTKQLGSRRPGPDKVESKAGRPPTKKTSLDGKPVTRPRHPMNNELPDFTGELDDDREELLAAVNAAINASDVACSGPFWKQVEPYFAFLTQDDLDFLKQLVREVEDIDLTHTSPSGSNQNGKADLICSPLPANQSPIIPSKQRSLANGCVDNESSRPSSSLNAKEDIERPGKFRWFDRKLPLSERLLSALIVEEDSEEANGIFYDGSQDDCVHYTSEDSRRGNCTKIESKTKNAGKLELEIEPEVEVKNWKHHMLDYCNYDNHFANGNQNHMAENICSDDFRQDDIVVQAEILGFNSESRGLDERHAHGGQKDQDELQSNCQTFGDIGAYDIQYQEMDLDQRILLELLSIGLFPESVPDLVQREDEEIKEAICKLKDELQQQVSKNKAHVHKLETAVHKRREVEEREREILAMNKLVDSAYNRHMGSRGTKKSGAKSARNKVTKQATLRFVKRTLAKCRMYDDTGNSCFSDTVVKANPTIPSEQAAHMDAQPEVWSTFVKRKRTERSRKDPIAADEGSDDSVPIDLSDLEIPNLDGLFVMDDLSNLEIPNVDDSYVMDDMGFQDLESLFDFEVDGI